MDYDDNEDAYWQSEFGNTIERNSDTDKPDTIHDGFGELTHRATIEKFVNQALRGNRPAFELKRSGELVFLPLSKYYALLGMMLSAYDDRYVGTPQVDAFFLAGKELGFLDQPSPFRLSSESPRQYCGTKRNAEWFNLLIDRVRSICSKGWYTKKIQRHKRRVMARLASGMKWEQDLFKGRSRHLMLFLTLGYKRSYRDEVTIEDFQADLNRLLNNRRSNGLLGGIKEYIWHREEGAKTGLHVHILIAYNDDRKKGSKGDMSISKEICDYWDTVITNGRGQAHSENLYRSCKEQRGQVDCLGQVDRGDDKKRSELRRRVIAYLVKADQLLKRKTSRFNSFGMSHPPEHSGKGKKPTKLGTPINVPSEVKAARISDAGRVMWAAA
jgi:hypothetical protein